MLCCSNGVGDGANKAQSACCHGLSSLVRMCGKVDVSKRDDSFVIFHALPVESQVTVTPMLCALNLRRMNKETFATITFKPGMRKRSFFCGSGSAKILPLPHKLFDLVSNLAKTFCPFPNVN